REVGVFLSALGIRLNRPEFRIRSEVTRVERVKRGPHADRRFGDQCVQSIQSKAQPSLPEALQSAHAIPFTWPMKLADTEDMLCPPQHGQILATLDQFHRCENDHVEAMSTH